MNHFSLHASCISLRSSEVPEGPNALRSSWHTSSSSLTSSIDWLSSPTSSSEWMTLYSSSSIGVATLFSVLFCLFGISAHNQWTSFLSGTRSSGIPSFANVTSKAKAVEGPNASKSNDAGKRGKKPNRILMSTYGGRRYWILKEPDNEIYLYIKKCCPLGGTEIC